MKHLNTIVVGLCTIGVITGFVLARKSLYRPYSPLVPAREVAGTGPLRADVYDPFTGESIYEFTNVTAVIPNHHPKEKGCTLIRHVLNGVTNDFHAWLVAVRISTNGGGTRYINADTNELRRVLDGIKKGGH